jgi:hypothetical protein
VSTHRFVESERCYWNLHVDVEVAEDVNEGLKQE